MLTLAIVPLDVWSLAVVSSGPSSLPERDQVFGAHDVLQDEAPSQVFGFAEGKPRSSLGARGLRAVSPSGEGRACKAVRS